MTHARRVSRRHFLKSTAVWAGLGTAPLYLPSRVLGREGHSGPNSRMQVAVIGCGFRGKYLIGNLPESAQVTALCDSFLQRTTETCHPNKKFTPILQHFAESDAKTCRIEQDYRRLLDQPGIDAAIVTTPDHHHVQVGMLALLSGRHLYVEKPLSLTIAEGRRLVDCANETGLVVQVGSQQRSMEVNQFACDFIRDGGLGKIHKVELENYPGPMMSPDFPASAIPSDLNWNLFCGPRPLANYDDRVWIKDLFKVDGLLWRGWDLYRDYSGHLMTNWGAHSIDMVQSALGTDETGPVEIEAIRPDVDVRELAADHVTHTPPPTTSGKETYDERRFWPVRMKYASGVELHIHGRTKAWNFHGELGTLTMGRNSFHTDPPDLIRNGIYSEFALPWSGDGHVARPHLQNWIDAINDGTPLRAPVEVGHRTASICHLANIARELNRPLHWNPDAECFVNDAEADALRDRPRRRGFELPS